MENLKANGATFGMIWFDIEGTQYWTKSETSNRAFFEGLVAEAKRLDVNFGIYSSASQWTPIFGSYNGGAAYQLWYAHYDGVQSFADFVPFGGWTKPAIKQYAGDKSACGLGIDLNWY